MPITLPNYFIYLFVLDIVLLCIFGRSILALL